MTEKRKTKTDVSFNWWLIIFSGIVWLFGGYLFLHILLWDFSWVVTQGYYYGRGISFVIIIIGLICIVSMPYIIYFFWKQYRIENWRVYNLLKVILFVISIVFPGIVHIPAKESTDSEK